MAESLLMSVGSSGDVADAFRPSGCASAVGWLPLRGALRFHHAPGHAPGLVRRPEVFWTFTSIHSWPTFAVCINAMPPTASSLARPLQVAYLHMSSGSAVVGDIVHQLGDPPVVDTSYSGTLFHQVCVTNLWLHPAPMHHTMLLIYPQARGNNGPDWHCHVCPL